MLTNEQQATIINNLRLDKDKLQKLLALEKRKTNEIKKSLKILESYALKLERSTILEFQISLRFFKNQLFNLKRRIEKLEK